MKIKLSLSPLNGGPFNCLPAREIELEEKEILCNSITLPWEGNPNRTRLYVIGNEFGVIGAVWADCDQDAFDELVDAGLRDSLLVDSADVDPVAEEAGEYAHLGNAGELANLDMAWIQAVRLDEQRDCRLLCAFAEARGDGRTTLDR